MIAPHEVIPETCVEALRRWDAGEPVFTIDMGGMGPGYEQAIQMLVFELVRDQLAAGPLPTFAMGPIPGTDEEDIALQKWWITWGEAAVSRSDDAVGGYSGAQVGAAKNLAFRCLRGGWRETVNSVQDAERKIQVSKYWPGVVPMPVEGESEKRQS